MSESMNIRRWQSARIVYAGSADTLLSRFSRANGLTAKEKMFGVNRAGAIMLRAFGGPGTGGLVIAGVRISGWMDPHNSNQDCGPGQRLWAGDLTLGTTGASSGIVSPLDLPSWLASEGGLWSEVSTWAASYNPFNALMFDSNTDSAMANKETLLVLPTLGYTHILIEVPSTSLESPVISLSDRAGFMWRPVLHNEVKLTF